MSLNTDKSNMHIIIIYHRSYLAKRELIEACHFLTKFLPGHLHQLKIEKIKQKLETDI